MSNYTYVFYILHLVFCLVYYVVLAKKNKQAMALFPMVIFIPYLGFISISTYFISISIRNSSRDIALDELMLPSEHMTAIGIENEAKVRNTIPIEEALKLNTHQIQRELVMEVAKRNPQQYLDILKKALLSTDTETAHYAATSIAELKRALDKRNLLATQAYKTNIYNLIVRREYIDSLDAIIKSGLSVDSVVGEYITSIIKALKYNINEFEKSEKKDYELLIEYLVTLDDFTDARKWIKVYSNEYPKYDGPLLLGMKVGYDSKDNELFRDSLQAINQADFPIRKSTMDLAKYWQQR